MGVCISSYFFISIILKYKNHRNYSSWQPAIGIDDYYWKNQAPSDLVDEKYIPKVINAANSYISNKVGKDFFNKYIKYYPYQSTISKDGTIYYLDYIVNIPEANITFKTTTHPVDIKLTINKDLSLVTPEQITNLPDCKTVSRCLDAANTQKAIETLVIDMGKTNFKATEIVIDWEFNSLQWYLRYDLPKEKMPNCEFNLGGTVTLHYDALKDKVVKRETVCISPGI